MISCGSNITMLWCLLCTKPCFQDHSGVLREQGISSEQSRPGDIYHPDFLLGCPAYFDLSVRSTTQSAVIISSASIQAGVAAAGELAIRTLNTRMLLVILVEILFLYLVCETFGAWFWLSILGSIVDRIIARNGLPCKLARHQLLAQLAVTLWKYNTPKLLKVIFLTLNLSNVSS